MNVKKRGVLLDLDNTLYNYQKAHDAAMDSLINHCIINFGISYSEAIRAYNCARDAIHIQLVGTASSHNRLLYFQSMLESLKISPLEHALDLYNLYWDTFIDNMTLYDGVRTFLERFDQRICIVSDLTAHIQYRKIHKLNISKYLKGIVTSEESGIEKPHAFPFLLALRKLSLTENEVFMVGDSFKKDVVGAQNLNIKTYWLNSLNESYIYHEGEVIELLEFKEILNHER